MNVREMLEALPRRYPSAIIQTEWADEPKACFEVTFKNGWSVSIGYGLKHYSSTRLYGLADPTESTSVEVAIFEPSGTWHLAEGMDVPYRGSTGVLGWLDSEQVFRIMDYISECEDKPP